MKPEARWSACDMHCLRINLVLFNFPHSYQEPHPNASCIPRGRPRPQNISVLLCAPLYVDNNRRSLLTVNSMVREALVKFDRIYELQAEGKVFATPEELWGETLNISSPAALTPPQCSILFSLFRRPKDVPFCQRV